jgi:FkbM family methyltransferase
MILKVRKLLAIVCSPRLSYYLFRYGVAATVEHKHILERPWKTIVDVGANRGQFTLAASEYANAQIFAFEPLPGPANIFQKLFSSYKSIKLYQMAIGVDQGSVDMHVSNRDDSSSLLKIGDLQAKMYPGTEEVSKLEIDVAPLDTILSPDEITGPALLKIDVQGYELEVLRGAKHLLTQFDAIYCECSFLELYEGQALVSDVLKLLHDHHFSLNGIFNVSYSNSGSCIQADFLFKKRVV